MLNVELEAPGGVAGRPDGVRPGSLFVPARAEPWVRPRTLSLTASTTSLLGLSPLDHSA